MHKIINKNSIQKITAIIIIMIMCNFIMNGKVFAGYGAATQDPGASTGNATSTGQNTGTIKDAIDVGVKSDEIKAKIKTKIKTKENIYYAYGRCTCISGSCRNYVCGFCGSGRILNL